MELQSATIAQSPLYALPFTRQQLRQDIQRIALLEMRKLSHLLGNEAVVPMLASVNSFAVWDAACSPDEAGITYEQVSKFTLAVACEDYFDYGFYAISGARTDPLQWDTIHTWIGAYLMDLSRSSYVAEWEGEGDSEICDAISRCMFVCELANARAMLEGGDYFFHFAGQDKDKEAGIPGLSLRQLALLSGMEEMSLRSYISRKTTPILEVCKSDRNTYVEIVIAKQWLTKKGRYRSVQNGNAAAEIDLSKSTFDNFNAFTAMLSDRLAYLTQNSVNRDAFAQSARNTLKTINVNALHELKVEAATDDIFLGKLAELLNLPANHLKHRAQESALKTQILLCQQQLKQLQHSTVS